MENEAERGQRFTVELEGASLPPELLNHLNLTIRRSVSAALASIDTQGDLSARLELIKGVKGGRWIIEKVRGQFDLGRPGFGD